MRKHILLVLLLAASFLNAQKEVKKIVAIPNITSIQIDASSCYELILETSNADTVTLEAVLDGEYRKELLLTTTKDGNTLIVNTNFQPDFISPNDKLSAHKVISIALKIKLPEHKEVTIVGGSCNTLVYGKYRELKVTLADGECVLDNISETALVDTKSGDIKVINTKAAIKATSKYGTIYKEDIPKGDVYLTLTSITGNIYLKKTE